MANILLLAGLGFGDEGKGSATDFLCRTHAVDCVVRYNGGAQCAHNVLTPKGVHHTFSQFGSGTFAGAKTHLSRYMLVNPITLDNEAAALERLIGDPYPLLTVEREALVTNPFQIAANRAKETLRGSHRHGSCGLGIGETVEDFLKHPDMAIRIGDLQDLEVLRRKLQFSRELKTSQIEPAVALRFTEIQDKILGCLRDPDAVNWCIERYTEIAKRLNIVDESFLPTLLEKDGTVLFEGAQGVLLDQDYGFHPYTTWSDTTFGNATELLQHAHHTGPVKRVGILRGYMTRHGAGPFPTEVPDPEIAQDVHNKYGEFQQGFRLGHFDLVLARYALNVIGGVDELILTNLDKLGNEPRICTKYLWTTEDGHRPTTTTCQELSVWEPANFAFQEHLTKGLTSEVTPFYEKLPTIPTLVQRIGQSLNVKVSFCSFGPTCEDKVPWTNS